MADSLDDDDGPDLSDPAVCYRLGLVLKSAALAFLETVPADVDPIVYGPGFELRLTRLDHVPTDPNQLSLFHEARHAPH